MGSGLIESIYERCMLRELELRSIPATTQQLVRIECKGVVFDEPLRFDIMVDSCLLLELKAVEALHPSSKAQLFSYMKLLDVPIGLPIRHRRTLGFAVGFVLGKSSFPSLASVKILCSWLSVPAASTRDVNTIFESEVE